MTGSGLRSARDGELRSTQPHCLPVRASMAAKPDVAGRRSTDGATKSRSPDTNSFHFVGGTSRGPTLATYDSQYMEDYVAEFMKNKQGN